MFTILVQLEVRPDMREEWLNAAAYNARESLARDPGCQQFEVWQVTDDPVKWMFYEVYFDEAAWLQHRESPHFLAYKAVADRALLSRVVVPLTPVFPAEASN